jgi:hypothetical protein
MDIKTLARRAQALAAINGGFFFPDYRPLGFLIVDGREVNPLRKADWGIFLIQDSRPRIIHTKEFENDGTISQALQVGPRLVVDGKVKIMKKQLSRRSALGITFFLPWLATLFLFCHGPSRLWRRRPISSIAHLPYFFPDENSSLYCSRMALFLNFPTLVLGISSTNFTPSGSCHRANFLPR